MNAGDNAQHHIDVGKLGEDIACRFLADHGFDVVCRNYRKKWGELDIVAKKKDILHFVEVKTTSLKNENVSRETSAQNVSRETSDEMFQPEDNVHQWKRKRLSRAILSYLSEKKVSDDAEWQFDMIGIILDIGKKTARVRFSEDIVLEE